MADVRFGTLDWIAWLSTVANQDDPVAWIR
jgi:hypothetical protein